MKVFAVLLCSAVSLAWKFGPDKTICDADEYARKANTTKGPTRPILPQQWSARVETSYRHENLTVNQYEFYDDLSQTAELILWMGGIKTRYLFHYDVNEIVVLTYDREHGPPSCNVTSIDNSTERVLFGDIHANGTRHMISANQVFRFGKNVPQVYMGQTTAHGVLTDTWESCTYVESVDATFKLTWHFSAQSWMTAIDGVVPVMARGSGILHMNQTNSELMETVYVVTDFQPIFLDSPKGLFETPAGTFCQGMAQTSSMPNSTSTFSFSAEITKSDIHYVDFIQEYYDYDAQLMKFDYVLSSNVGFGANKLVNTVHDFRTGVAYHINAEEGNCIVTKIGDLLSDFVKTSNGSLRMRTSREFFFETGVKFQYNGKRTIRGVLCDVFSAVVSSYKLGDMPTLHEWYFADITWSASVSQWYQYRNPLMLRMTSADQSISVVYNIFGWKATRPKIESTDITTCFNSTQRRDFQVRFSGVYWSNVTADILGFKSAVVQTVSAATGVSFIRVQHVQVDYTGGNILVTFALLGEPAVQGDVKRTAPYVDLTTAVNKLTTAVKSSLFTVNLPNWVSMTAIPNSSNDPLIDSDEMSPLQ